jgi:hypothetical protein
MSAQRSVARRGNSSGALRAYEARGALELSEAASIGEAKAFFDTMKQSHIASWQRRRRRHAFATPHFERFQCALIEREFGRCAVQLLRIAVGGAPIGYLHNLRSNGIVYAYRSDFDGGHCGLSPGVVSHALALHITPSAASGFTISSPVPIA